MFGMLGAVRDVGCRAAGFRTSGRRARGFPSDAGVFRISFFSRRWEGSGGGTHRDEGPSQGLVGLLLLDSLGGEENFAVERAAAAFLGARPSLPLPASEARAVLHIRPGDRGEVVVAREKGKNLGAIALEAFAPTVAPLSPDVPYPSRTIVVRVEPGEARAGD